MKTWTALFVIGMFATTVAMADDVDDVKAAVQSYFDAINSGNAAGVARHRIALTPQAQRLLHKVCGICLNDNS